MITANISFPPDHPSFNGHFPNNPILPAFMQVQAALDLLTTGGRSAGLARIESARFPRPIRPNDPVLVEIATLSGNAFAVTLSVAGQHCSRFDLYTQESSPSER